MTYKEGTDTMTYPLPPADVPRDDTPRGASPVDEFESRDRRFWLGFALLVIAVMVAVWVAVRFWRLVGRLFAAMFSDGADVTYGPAADVPGAVPSTVVRYRLHYFDGTYEQLRDRRMFMMIDESLPQEMIRGQLGRHAAELQRQVELRDSQRSFNPRVELRDDAGRVAWWYP
jgi:hypothetical protein